MMEAPAPSLAGVRKNLDRLEEIAQLVYAEHEHGDGEAWSLEDYIAGIDQLRAAIDHAACLPPCSPERYEAEKAARNKIATRLYYRGRLCLKKKTVGRFYKKVGEKGVDWAPTELSRLADRLAAEPLRQIYKKTEACLESRN